MLGEGDTFGNNGRFGAPGKKFRINFSKAKAKSFLSLHYNHDDSYLFVSGKEIYKFKANYPTKFCLRSIANKSDYVESSVKGNVYNFSVDYNPIDKSDILNIQKYLMVKNNI